MKLQIGEHFKKLKEIQQWVTDVAETPGQPSTNQLTAISTEIAALLKTAPPDVDDIPNDNRISAYFHCGHCLKRKPSGQSPQEWGRLEAGWTAIGLQVVCVRCGRNVVHIHFENAQHPANLTSPANPAGKPS